MAYRDRAGPDTTFDKQSIDRPGMEARDDSGSKYPEDKSDPLDGCKEHDTRDNVYCNGEPEGFTGSCKHGGRGGRTAGNDDFGKTSAKDPHKTADGVMTPAERVSVRRVERAAASEASH